jgi:aminoglycoside phosphotransferase
VSYLEGLRREAETVVAELTRAHSQYTVSDRQPEYRGGTNQILFGKCDGTPIVYKYFVTPERFRNEIASLRHFAPTGLVPAILYEQDERLLVMARLSGQDLFAELPTLNAGEVAALSRNLGKSLVALSSVKPPPKLNTFTIFEWGADMPVLLGHYLSQCRLMQKDVPDYQTPLFDQSLAWLEAEIDVIGEEETLLYHEDLSNMCVAGDRVTGFYDLEMARVGTISLQLGQALSLCGEGRLSWRDLVQGYESQSGRKLTERNLQSILAMSHFYHWIRICRGGRWSEQRDEDACRALSEDSGWYGREFRRLNGLMLV